MLILKLNRENADSIVFDYFPENRDDFGTLEISKVDGEISIIRIAKGDEYRIYLQHAASTMTKYYENNQYEEKNTVAWY